MGGLAGLIIAIPAGGILKKTVQFLLPDEPGETEGEREDLIYMAENVDEKEEGGRREEEGKT